MNRDTNHVVLITMSKIFSPFRAVGFCCNSVPLSLSVRGSTALIATAVGKAFHVYNVSCIINYIFNDEFSFYSVQRSTFFLSVS